MNHADTLYTQKYSHLSRKLFDVVYARAYEAGHAYGYVEVEHQFEDFFEFAIRVWECANPIGNQHATQ